MSYSTEYLRSFSLLRFMSENDLDHRSVVTSEAGGVFLIVSVVDVVIFKMFIAAKLRAVCQL